MAPTDRIIVAAYVLGIAMFVYAMFMPKSTLAPPPTQHPAIQLVSAVHRHSTERSCTTTNPNED
jgi:hypothetical protein